MAQQRESLDRFIALLPCINNFLDSKRINIYLQSNIFAMKAVKCYTRSCLTDEDLENELRCSVTSLMPNFDSLTYEMDCQMSHECRFILGRYSNII